MLSCRERADIPVSISGCMYVYIYKDTHQDICIYLHMHIKIDGGFRACHTHIHIHVSIRMCPSSVYATRRSGRLCILAISVHLST